MQTEATPLTPKPSSVPRAFLVTLVVAAVFFTAVAAYSVHPRLPFNTIQLPGEGSPLDQRPFPLQVVMPQGWKFFTKSPRDPELVIWEQGANQQWKAVNDRTISDTGGTLNFDRTSRAIGVEMAMLIHHAKKGDWATECRDSDTACLARASEKLVVRNTMPHPRLCGRVGFISRPPVPFAWADSLKAPMPASALIMRVQCES